MKEMEYTFKHIFEVLDKGSYKGYQYVIMNYGHHPCCYVALEKGDRYYEVEYEDIELDCHGGTTYSNYGLIYEGCNPKKIVLPEEFWVIGWDYRHTWDYNALFNEVEVGEPPFLNKCKKWTTQDMLDEVHSVIEQLNFINTEELLYA